MQYLVSGLGALVAATITIMNVFNARIFLGNKIVPRVLAGSVIGLIGLVVVFWGELIKLHNSHHAFIELIAGTGFCLLATYFASLGNIISAYTQKHKLSVLSTNAYGMAYATLFFLIIAFFRGDKIVFSMNPIFITSLIYLIVIGTIVAFQCYLTLLGRMGPEKVAYIFVITPIVALVISTFFENFIWSTNTFLGIFLIILGNVLVLLKKAKPPVQTHAKPALEQV